MRQFALWRLLHALLVRVTFAAMRPAESGGAGIFPLRHAAPGAAFRRCDAVLLGALCCRVYAARLRRGAAARVLASRACAFTHHATRAGERRRRCSSIGHPKCNPSAHFAAAARYRCTARAMFRPPPPEEGARAGACFACSWDALASTLACLLVSRVLLPLPPSFPLSCFPHRKISRQKSQLGGGKQALR
jgi:hypothetical protein